MGPVRQQAISAIIHRREREREEGGEVKRTSEDSEEEGEERLRVVDCGCGGGLVTDALATQCHLPLSLVGLDIEPAAIADARAHADASKTPFASPLTTVRFHVDSVVTLQTVRDGSVDVALCLDVLEHLPTSSLALTLHTIASKLKPGGYLFVDTLNRTVTSYVLGIALAQGLPISPLPSHTHSWEYFTTPGELRALGEEAGLDWLDEECRGFGPTASLAFFATVLTPVAWKWVQFKEQESVACQYMAAFRKPTQ